MKTRHSEIRHPCPPSSAGGRRAKSAIATGRSTECLWQELEAELHTLRDRELLRTLSTIDAVKGTTVRLDGRWMVVWCANDYLGLSTHPRVIQAASDAAAQWGVGARASRLLAGSTTLHQELEERLASFFHADAAAVFSSGYLANLGVLGALANQDDLLLVDRLAHASLIDACRLTRARLRIFHHNDVAHVERLLTRNTGARRRLVVTEGLFSMDGDFAPLPSLRDVVQRHGAQLYVDDAHGAFAVGATGRGSPEVAGVPHETMIYMGTLGKALGCQGGFVVGPTPLIRLLQNRARTFVYATALATPIVAAALEALRLVETEADLRRRLARSIQTLWGHLKGLPGLRAGAPTHIIPVIVGSSLRARALSASLWQRGIFAPAIRPPTVPEGTARLRLSLSVLHTERHLEELADALREGLTQLAHGAHPT